MFKKVCIVGTGFMGGSFALALRETYPHCTIFGYDINPEAIKKALELGILDKGNTSLESIKSFEPELIVLATPVGSFYSLAPSIASLDIDCIITDLGSVKGHLVYFMEKHLGGKFVGGHPIAGTEKSGVENSIKGLFKNKKCILTPTERTSTEALSKVKKLWEDIGSIVEEMDPCLHDYVFGAVSHLPHAVAFALVDAIINLSKDGIDLFEYTGAGFKDFTRIAMSDPVMWRDIFIENSREVLKAIEVFENSLKRLKEFIADGKREELMDYLKEAKEKREKIS